MGILIYVGYIFGFYIEARHYLKILNAVPSFVDEYMALYIQIYFI